MEHVLRGMQGPWGIGAMLAVAYGFGCLTPGYYLVRRRTGLDLRATGSGSVGARNTARTLGWRAGLAVFGLDVAKGAAAMGLARWLRLPDPALAAVLVATVAGHVWPVQLRFRGGRGAATSMGALLAWQPALLALLLGLFALAWAGLGEFMLGGLLVFALSPAVAWLRGGEPPVVAAVAAMAGIVLYAHRQHLRQVWVGRARSAAEDGADRGPRQG
ncbi:MAG: glycerol-3-phosphate acyltransferase [Armatimonadetes bacterium]|nr:glycerol-3-phosphate acyltransferase [Armatimonadota bacterium]